MGQISFTRGFVTKKRIVSGEVTRSLARTHSEEETMPEER